jgi:hypothetical protein
MSFFISYVDVNVTEEDVKHVFEKDVGIVERVDFFVKKGWTFPNKKSAFVHLKEWYFTDTTNEMYDWLEKGDSYWRLTNKVRIGEGHWNVKKMMRRKIQKTEYNIHQMADQLKQQQRRQVKMEKELQQIQMILSGPLEVLREDEDTYTEMYKDKPNPTRSHTYFEEVLEVE